LTYFLSRPFTIAAVMRIDRPINVVGLDHPTLVAGIGDSIFLVGANGAGSRFIGLEFQVALNGARAISAQAPIEVLDCIINGLTPSSQGLDLAAGGVVGPRNRFEGNGTALVATGADKVVVHNNRFERIAGTAIRGTSLEVNSNVFTLAPTADGIHLDQGEVAFNTIFGGNVGISADDPAGGNATLIVNNLVVGARTPITATLAQNGGNATAATATTTSYNLTPEGWPLYPTTVLDRGYFPSPPRRAPNLFFSANHQGNGWDPGAYEVPYSD
jgi:hypothetical protein